MYAATTMAMLYRTASDSIAFADVATAEVRAFDATVRVTCWVTYYGGPLDGDMELLTFDPVRGHRVAGHSGVYRQAGEAIEGLGVTRMDWSHRV